MGPPQPGSQEQVQRLRSNTPWRLQRLRTSVWPVPAWAAAGQQPPVHCSLSPFTSSSSISSRILRACTSEAGTGGSVPGGQPQPAEGGRLIRWVKTTCFSPPSTVCSYSCEEGLPPPVSPVRPPGCGGGRGAESVTLDRGEKGPALAVPSNSRRARPQPRGHWAGIMQEAGQRGSCSASAPAVPSPGRKLSQGRAGQAP